MKARSVTHYLVNAALIICLALSTLNCAEQNSGEDETLPPATGAATLPIAPVYQQAIYWCWAASAEMIFRYYDLPNLYRNADPLYQCGIVTAWFTYTTGSYQCLADCRNCPYPIDTMSSEYRLITGYGAVARGLGLSSPDLTASQIVGPLNARQIKAEIDAGRPILAGISPGAAFIIPNSSLHAVVIVGYDFEGPTQTVIVNDPFPYEFVLSPNPYTFTGGFQTRLGQYKVPLAALYSSLAWGNTIYKIR